MRINNPKAMVGFERSTNSDSIAYNLATVGQVKNAIKDLKNDITSLLYGKFNDGMSSGHGYAWLNAQGVVDTSLLPKLAITETHTVSQGELMAISALPTTTFTKDEEESLDLRFKKILNIWLKNKVNEGEEGATFQTGDVIIVTVPAGETPNPVYAGSYIITAVPGVNTTDDFVFSKMAYSDGNIVSINNQIADNVGNLRLSLWDILNTRYLREYAPNANDANYSNGLLTANTKTEELTDSVYRLVSIKEDAGYRFAFIDDSDQAHPVTIPYTKLKEFTDEQESTVERFNEVHELIEALSARHDSELKQLTDKHNTELSALTLRHENETSFISGTIGERTDIPNRSNDASIFAQTRKLRKDVDDNLSAFIDTADVTDQMLRLVQTNAQYLHQGLNQRAVRLFIQEFVWEEDMGIVQTENYNQYLASATDVSGVVHWRYTHSPHASNPIAASYNVNGTTLTQQDLVGTNGTLFKQGILNTANSEERVLAVYDDNFNLVQADIKLVDNKTTGLTDTVISIDIDYVGSTSAGIIGTLATGKPWSLLIAKTIDGIDFNPNLITVFDQNKA